PRGRPGPGFAELAWPRLSPCERRVRRGNLRRVCALWGLSVRLGRMASMTWGGRARSRLDRPGRGRRGPLPRRPARRRPQGVARRAEDELAHGLEGRALARRYALVAAKLAPVLAALRDVRKDGLPEGVTHEVGLFIDDLAAFLGSLTGALALVKTQPPP